MNTNIRKEAWLDHVNSWKKSGLSISKYCKENGLKSSTFHYWIRKTGKKAPQHSEAGNFVKLEIPGTISTDRTESFSLKYGSYEITIPTAFNKKDMGKLLEVLEARITC